MFFLCNTILYIYILSITFRVGRTPVRLLSGLRRSESLALVLTQALDSGSGSGSGSGSEDNSGDSSEGSEDNSGDSSEGSENDLLQVLALDFVTHFRIYCFAIGCDKMGKNEIDYVICFIFFGIGNKTHQCYFPLLVL